jgi:hypothetical protein
VARDIIPIKPDNYQSNEPFFRKELGTFFRFLLHRFNQSLMTGRPKDRKNWEIIWKYVPKYEYFARCDVVTKGCNPRNPRTTYSSLSLSTVPLCNSFNHVYLRFYNLKLVHSSVSAISSWYNHAFNPSSHVYLRFCNLHLVQPIWPCLFLILRWIPNVFLIGRRKEMLSLPFL